MPDQRRHQFILLAASSAIAFASLGAAHLWDLDEAIFSQTAREMADRGDWVVPYFNGKIFPDKPAMMYWLMMIGYKIFGPTEFAARFWSAVFGVATTLVTYRIGRRLFSPAAGFWGALVLATSLNFAVIERAATPDSFLIFFSTLAIWLFVAGTFPKPEESDNAADTETVSNATRSFWPKSAISWAAAYGAMALGVLTKGPIGIVLPTSVIGLFLLTLPRGKRPATSLDPSIGRGLAAHARALLHWIGGTFAPRHLLLTIWNMRPLTALAVLLVVAGPWYAWVGVRTEGVWLRDFIGVQNIDRFLHPMDNHAGPIFYYIPALMIGVFPWTLFLLLGLMQAVRRMRAGHPRQASYALLLSWAAVWIGFFSLASTKLPSYIVPAYPALALLTGALLYGWCVDPATIRREWLRVAWLLLGATGLGLLFIMPILADVESARQLYLVFLESAPWIGLLGIVPLVGAAMCCWFAERERQSFAAAALASTAFVFFVALESLAVPRVDRHQNSEQLAEAVTRHKADGNVHLGSYHHFRASLVFYAHHPIQKLDSPETILDFFCREPKNAFLFTTDQQYEHLASRLPPDVIVLESSPRFLQSGKALLLGRSAGSDHGPPLWNEADEMRQAGKAAEAARN